MYVSAAHHSAMSLKSNSVQHKIVHLSDGQSNATENCEICRATNLVAEVIIVLLFHLVSKQVKSQERVWIPVDRHEGIFGLLN